MSKIVRIINTGKNSIENLRANIKYGKKVGEIVSDMEGSGRLGRIKNISEGIISTTAKPIAGNVVKDLTGVKNLPSDISVAYNTGKAASDAMNPVSSAIHVTKTVYKDGIKPHVPGLLAWLGLAIPIPTIQPTLYAIGKLFQKIF